MTDGEDRARRLATRELERLELELLLEAIHRRYGFDFREYAPASLKRRVWRRIRGRGAQLRLGPAGGGPPRPDVMERLLLDLSINVTSMFRDPTLLRRVPRAGRAAPADVSVRRIWNAGCSTGEETYSLAILLEEEGV